jgi:hypothetical protein
MLQFAVAPGVEPALEPLTALEGEEELGKGGSAQLNVQCPLHNFPRPHRQKNRKVPVRCHAFSLAPASGGAQGGTPGTRID